MYKKKKEKEAMKLKEKVSWSKERNGENNKKFKKYVWRFVTFE